MREDWNRRALEDAHYYVAFGRRGQTEEEFSATASEQVLGLLRELRRLRPVCAPESARVLEIGCGPGRLMKPLSRSVGEIHGVDISDEMIRRAGERLRGIPNAHVYHAPASDLSHFPGASFDFVYSYAVFQHIPSREVVINYLHEARRVLRTGGILRCQLNGLPPTAARYDTWSGVRFQAEEMAAFARNNDMQLLALEGALTQYMWITCRKRATGWIAALDGSPGSGSARLRRITNAHSSEPVAPSRGRFACVSLWLENLPQDIDLNHLEVRIGSQPATPVYIGEPERDGLRQVNVWLPPSTRSGLQPVRLLWLGKELCPPATLRVIPPGPLVPCVMAVTDGVNLLSGTTIVSGTVKVVLEEASKPEEFGATVGSHPARDIDIFCTDPAPPRYEINFSLPAAVRAGDHLLEMHLGGRRLAPVRVRVAPEE